MAFGFLDVVEDSFCVSVRDYATELVGGIVGDTSAKNDCFCVFLFEQLKHLFEWEGAADVGVEDKETFWPAFEDGITEMVEASSCA